ncbi:DegT/DnrJ/EryC1/StrS family aminotransferase [Pseudonocardia bannensis]|uniref:DegT/DnrJ/EryC1/StrS family aminotransferase n=1 Tax=Pseudonocardia bannensis TaxID=630973 RepID=UPI0028AF69A6|nr:DegT/DnrJ/EryC1/StrS family aminotransferase [Pseudonocardia bannensis]
MNPGPAIPFLDLQAVNAEYRFGVELAFKTILDHGRFVGGPEVEEFEQEFAAYCEAEVCVGVGNGTDAIELILAGLGIGRGDEVILPANTFVATAEAVCAVGARPRFVDVLPDTLLIDPAAVADAVNSSTAAVIAVHLFGQMADVARLRSITERFGLALLEDAAQAHGARFGGRRAGSVGNAAAFSFYPGKNLGAFGDGGAVVTSDRQLAARVRRFADHGRSVDDRHRHHDRGRNSRLDSIQAAVLTAKLPELDRANASRNGVMAHYRANLPEDCIPVAVDPESEPVHHLAVVQVPDRARTTAVLSAAKIGWGVHYPIPCHRQPAFAEFAEHLPEVEKAAPRILSLPMFPTLAEREVERVCNVVKGTLQ